MPPGTLTRADLAAWLLRCRPDVWDIDAALARPGPVPFALPDTYRTRLVLPGDPVWLFVGGSRAGSGLRASGVVTAGATTRTEPALWRDRDRGLRPARYVDVRWRPVDAPRDRAALRAHPGLAGLELLRIPRAVNPGAVTVAEHLVLCELTGGSRGAP